MSRGLNGVATDRHGLILWENEAMGSRKVFRCLLYLWDAIFKLKIGPRGPKIQNPMFQYLFVYFKLPIDRPGG